MVAATPERLINQAKCWIGYVEKKSNKNLDDFEANAGKKNYTRFNRDYVSVMKGHNYPGSINMQWCAAYVSCMFMYEFGVDAARKLLCGDLHCYTPAGAKYFKNKGRYTKRKNADPQPGDVVFFYSSSKGRIGHVGIVTKVDSSKVYTVEGNTSGGSKLVTNGGAVWEKSYKKTSTYIDGYGRPDYENISVPETPPENWVTQYTLGDRVLEKNMTGPDVKELQEMLVTLGYGIGKWGVDGDFGSDTESAVKRFQKDYKLVTSGVVDAETLEFMRNAMLPNDPEGEGSEEEVEEKEPEPEENSSQSVQVCSGNTINVRIEPNTDGEVLGIVRNGDTLEYLGETSENGWFKVSFQGQTAWISGKYTELIQNEQDLEGTSGEESPTYIVDALDLSSYNSKNFNNIDWAAIRDNVGFLILRAGITRVKTKPLGIGPDSYFAKYAEKCMEYGIPYWVYYYSQAKTINDAREEADYLYEVASSGSPVGYALDCEEKNIKVSAFFARLNELGVERTMLYIGHNWYPVYNLPVDDDGYIKCASAVWIPYYGKNTGKFNPAKIPKYKCDLHQFTSKFAFYGVPDKTLDANRVTGTRRSIAWFRGEE